MAKIEKGVELMLQDLGKEFAAGTGMIMLTVTFRQTLTGWQMIVKRMNGKREKEVLFVDHDTIVDLLDVLYNVVYHDEHSSKWKPDKF